MDQLPRRDSGLDVAEHVAAFNHAVATGQWTPFVERFADDAVLGFVGPPVGPFEGRAAIAAAYESSPPDDTIEVVDSPTVDGDELVVRYRWVRTGATGSMQFRSHDGLIDRLVVTFD